MADKQKKTPDQLAFSIQKAKWLCWTALDHATCEISAGVLALPGFGKAGSIAQNRPYQGILVLPVPVPAKPKKSQPITNANMQKKWKSLNIKKA